MSIIGGFSKENSASVYQKLLQGQSSVTGYSIINTIIHSVLGLHVTVSDSQFQLTSRFLPPVIYSSTLSDALLPCSEEERTEVIKFAGIFVSWLLNGGSINSLVLPGIRKELLVARKTLIELIECPFANPQALIEQFNNWAKVYQLDPIDHTHPLNYERGRALLDKLEHFRLNEAGSSEATTVELQNQLTYYLAKLEPH